MIILMPFWGYGQVGGQSFCGTYQGVPPGTNNPDSLAYDRFGNAIHINKLAIPITTGPALTTIDCSTSYFNLTFYATPTTPADPNNAICRVFKYLSENIVQQMGTNNCGTTSPQKVNLQVAWLDFADPDTDLLEDLDVSSSDLGGPTTAGIGTPFSTSVDNGCKEVTLDRPFIKINGGIPPGGSAGFDGRILLNTNINWNYDPDATNFPDQLDLYSVVLHEALHVLGFASRMNQTDAYSLWDQTLRVVDAYTSGGGGANPKRAIMTEISTGNQLNCTENCWQENTTLPGSISSLVVQPCAMPGSDVVVGDAAIAAVGGYNDGSSIDNILSHLNENCNAPLVDYVMSPGIALGQIQRIVSDPEWNILCALGYTTTSCAGCYSIAHGDELVDPNANCCFKTFYGCLGSSIEVLKSDLLCNDITNGDDLKVINLYNFGMPPSITPNTAGNGWIISNNGTIGGSNTIYYSIRGCDCRMHNQSFRVVFERECPDCIYDGDMCENLLCYNDFENYTQSFEAWFGHPFILEGNIGVGTPDINIVNGNHYLYMGGGIDFNKAIEPVTMELNKCIPPRCSLLFEVDLLYGLGMSVADLEIWGSSVAPCDISENAGAFSPNECGLSSTCNPTTTFSPHCINTLLIPNYVSNPENFTFQPADHQEFIWPNLTDDDICFLTLIPRNGSVFLDNIKAKIECEPTVTCNYMGDPEICHNATTTMTWSVCAEETPGSTSTTITTNITLPVGVTATNPSQLTQTVTLATGACATISVDVTTSLSIGTVFTASMNGTGTGVCNESAFNCTEQITVIDCTPDPLCPCPPTASIIPIGTEGQSVSLSATTLNSSYESTCFEIQGQLIVDKNWNLTNCNLKMGKGAEIVIQPMAGSNIKPKLILKGNVIEGCDYMWRGIFVNSLGQLEATDLNKIYDAQWAIKVARKESNVTVIGNEFYRNFVGIYAPESAINPNYFATVINGGITGNKFLYGGPLKLPYGAATPGDPSPQIPAPGVRGFAGVVLEKVSGFNIGAGNLFEGLRNGVVANNSTFSVSSCTFKNLVTTLVPPGQGQWESNNYGIGGFSCQNMIVNDNEFTGTELGIYAIASSITASLNTYTGNTTINSEGSDAGITILNGANRHINLNDNTINCQNFGIRVLDCIAPSSFNILRNYIHPMANSIAPCISLYNVKGEGSIYDNHMINNEMGNSPAGLNLLNCANLTIGENDLSGLYSGIVDQGGLNNFLYNNHVIQASTINWASSAGISTTNSVDFFCNNTTNQTGQGFFFRGMCTPTDFGCNKIGNSVTGLYLDYASDNPNTSANDPLITKIGVQDNKGNIWNGATYGGFKAYNAVASTPTDVLASQFLSPLAQIPIPWSTGLGGSVEWFKPSPGTPPTCTTCPSPFLTSNEGDGKKLGSDDIKTARNEHESEAFNWMARQRLYRRLAYNPDLVDKDIDISDFYQSSSGSTIGQLHSIEVGKHLLVTRDPVARTQWNTLQTELMSLHETLISVQNAGSGGDVLAWESSLANLQTQIETKALALDALESGFESARVTEAAALLAQNGQVVTPNLLATNEQAVNNLYLTNALWTNAPVSDIVLDELKIIADQCPDLGGFAVYEARSLYAQRKPGMTWDDEKICSPAQERESKFVAVDSKSKYMVMPNPANNLLWIKPANGVWDQSCSFNLYDSYGRLVLTQELEFNASESSVQISKIPAGVYYHSLIGDGFSTNPVKLIILH